METLEYDYDYNSGSIKVDCELPNAGSLAGRFGSVRFERVPDGFAVFDSTLTHSGFATEAGWECNCISVPFSINGIPVVELHQTINGEPLDEPREYLGHQLLEILIEGGNLKRVFLDCLHYHDPNYKKIRIRTACRELALIFWNSNTMQKLRISNDARSVPTYAFNGCAALRDLFIPDSASKIGEYAFLNCGSLQAIQLPSELKNISEGSFKNCRSLRKVFLADSIEIIENSAFEGCESLRAPWIPIY